MRKARSPSSRMLWGLTSRWTMPAAWAASSAPATWPSSSTASAGGSGPVGGDPALQVAALDQPHRDDQLAVLLAGVVDGDDVGVVEPGGEARLAQEPLAEALVVGEVAGDHLERHRPVEGQVRRPVDDAHPAARDQRVDAVPAERGADCRFRHAAVIPPSPGGGPLRRGEGARDAALRALAARLPGDDRAERRHRAARRRRFGGNDALGELAGRAVGDGDRGELRPLVGLDEGRDPLAVGGEDGVGLRARRAARSACGRRRRPIRFTQRPWSRRKSSVWPSGLTSST